MQIHIPITSKIYIIVSQHVLKCLYSFLRLSVSLRVKGSIKRKTRAESILETIQESGRKTRVSVRNNRCWDTVKTDDLSNIQIC